MKRLSAIILLFLAIPVNAQAPDADKAREAAELRVEADMVQMNSIVEAMAKNLGQLHYLRQLCFGFSDQKWRNYASQMMDLESTLDPSRRSNMIQAYNSGYHLEQDRHSTCSESVTLDVAALAENGRNLAAMLGDPYREH